MRRREFINALIGGVTAARPLAGIAAVLAPGSSRAQAPNTIRRLGVLMSQTVSDPIGQARVRTLVQALAALHRREGDNLRIDWRWGGGDPALFDRYATELVALEPDVLLALSTPAVAALQRRTTTIPIVFAVVTDPVGQQFVESLARPGGNITGFTDFDAPMVAKWLGMLAQITPRAARVVVLFLAPNRPAAAHHR